MDGSAPIVVKLGGSFAFSAHLRNWIEALAACAGRVVIVPGGGPFADAVRLAQTRMGFDNRAAHHMAVLAMEQYGRALVSLNSKLSAADSEDAIRHDLVADRVPVWMPSAMVLRATDLAESWEVTSDSLAAWLVGRIGAHRLLLVKHAKFECGGVRFEDLVATGIVDEAFTRHLKMSAAAAYILGPSDHKAVIAAIREGANVGTPVE
jgi:5-(aminomethyl)-3-furanmethanol phosphate kinase